MSDSWVNDRLESQVGEDKAIEIQKAMSKGNVDKVISTQVQHRTAIPSPGVA